MNLDAVLFDLDGTLHDRETSLVRFAVDQWARWPALRAVPRDDFVVALVALDGNGRVAKHEVYGALVAQFGLKGVAADDLVGDYLVNLARHAVLFPGAMATLQALRNEDLKLGIVSNGPTALQSAVIEACGLYPLMDVVVISEAAGWRKPDRRIFGRALAELGVAAERCAFVGDHPEADIAGARNAGMKTAWRANNGFGRATDTAVFRRYGELGGVLRGL